MICTKKIVGWLAVALTALCFLTDVSAFAEKRTREPAGDSRTAILADQDFFPALIQAIDGAKHEILMSIFSFKVSGHKNSYPDQIVYRLEQAVKRGVNVSVVLETTRNSDDDLNIQNRKTGKLLEKKGVRVYYDSPRKTTHTKLTVIDQRLIFLGSHNLTQSALRHNNEISVVIDRPDMAVDVQNYILHIIKEGK